MSARAPGQAIGTSVITVVIAVNTFAGVTQEVRGGRAITALSQLTAPGAWRS